MEDKIDPRWRKSSYSGNGGGNCVEVAAQDRVLVRDTKNRAGTVLLFAPAAWRRFAHQIQQSLPSGPFLGLTAPKLGAFSPCGSALTSACHVC
jgi:hypothetical protein